MGSEVLTCMQSTARTNKLSGSFPNKESGISFYFRDVLTTEDC